MKQVKTNLANDSRCYGTLFTLSIDVSDAYRMHQNIATAVMP